MRAKSRMTIGWMGGVAVAAAVIGASPAHADTFTWNVNDGNVSVAGNWSPNGLPTNTVDIGIIGGGASPIKAKMTNALAGPPAQLQVKTNGTLSIDKPISAEQNIVMMGGTLGSGANWTYSGSVFLDSASTVVGYSSMQPTLSGAIKNNGGNAGKLIVAGTGFVLIGGAAANNTYSGGTEILSNATLTVKGSSGTGSGDVTLDAGGILRHETVTLIGRIISNGGTIETLASYYLTASIGLKANTIISVVAGAPAIQGAITDEGGSPGKLIKQGAGKYILNNAGNTYTSGTEVKAGTLEISSTGRLPDKGAVMIHSGATLSYLASSDTIGGLAGVGLATLGATVMTNAEGMSPGTNLITVGTLTATGTTARLVLGANSTNLFHLIAPGNADQVVLQGLAKLRLGGTIQVEPAGQQKIASGDYTLFDLNGGTLDGTMPTLITPAFYTGTVATNTGDVVLSLKSIPRGSLIVIR